MSRYSLKPKQELSMLYDEIAAGFYAGHCSAFFFMACPRHPDDHAIEVDIEGTGVQVCEQIKKYCDLTDPLTKDVYDRIIMDVNPRNVGMPAFVHWKLYRMYQQENHNEKE